MKKMRVFELAKELSIDTRDLLKIAKDLAISVENTMSMVDVHDIERIKKRFDKDMDTQKQTEDTEDDAYVDKRVSANVIRRRTKVTAPEPTEPEIPSEEIHEALETTAVEEETLKGEEPSKIMAAKSPKTEDVSEEKQAEAVEQEPEKKKIGIGQLPDGSPLPQGSSGQAASAGEQEAGAVQEEKKEPSTEAQTEEDKKEKKKEKKKGKKGKLPEPEVVEEVKEKPAKTAVKKPKRVKEKEVYTQRDLYGSDRSSFGKKQKRLKGAKKGQVPLSTVKKKKIKIGKGITVSNLAHEMGVKVSEVIKVLMELGVMANQNQFINPEEALVAATELGFEAEEARDEIKEEYLSVPEYAQEDLKPRPPVITVMGHVDHGKTSLLDAIRKENVIDTESGGITQHIGAYQARCKGKLITFIDTPGHEAFTSMRARGAQVTDFVVLVVAADDGVMDQTREAINHAKAAEIPILVAVNKIDKQNANPQRVKEQLSEYGLVPEEWGGDTIFVDVSAKQHTGIEDLLEMILLQAEVLDIKACPDGPARGIVLESRLDKNRGPMATVLIQHGIMNQGDVFVVGSTWGKARAMYDFTGSVSKKSTPATPVELIGLNGLPSAGDPLFIVPNEKKAKEIIAYFDDNEEIARQQSYEQKAQLTLQDLYNQVQEGKLKELNLIIKGDVHGTVEAIVGTVKGIDVGEDIRINVIHSAVGGITENDVLLASTSSAIIVGFNVRPEPKAKLLGRKYNIELKLYTVIYDIIEDIKKALKGLLEPVYEEVVQGRAEVRDLFKVPKMGVIAGCMVQEGMIHRGASARLLRDNVVIHQGKIESLKRFKDDAKEVSSGYECGIGFGSFNDLKVGDIVEAFTQVRVEIED